MEDYAHFDKATDACVITNPLTPAPWINYLTNRRLSAFISQNAGGFLWHLEPQTRRISRYHYMATPADRPGFYIYVRDQESGDLWNPHFAPVCAKLDRYECRHEPGLTTFTGECGGIRTEVAYTIPPARDVMLWRLELVNLSDRPRRIRVASYLEFGLLEVAAETWWCYDKNQVSFTYDPDLRAIRYDYHVFEATHTPRMLFGCSAPVSGFECSRDAFVGRGGGLERPAAMVGSEGPSGSELPTGGHGCGVLMRDVALKPGARETFAYVFSIGSTWDEAAALLEEHTDPKAVDAGFRDTQSFWRERFSRFRVRSGDAPVDRFVNTWNPWNCAVTSMGRTVSTDHTVFSGFRFRDTMQDAMAAGNIDPDYARWLIRCILATQKADGNGCHSFDPFNESEPEDSPDRSDRSVWPVDAVINLVSETGELSFLEDNLPYRDGDSGTVFEHLYRGLRFIHSRRGLHGLPMMFDADWNDDLILFGDRQAESVMLGMQLVHACRRLRNVAMQLERETEAEWCRTVVGELTEILNSDAVWDGRWYRRLLLTNGKALGSADCREGRIFLEPQVWSVISGVGDEAGRGRLAMDSVAQLLDTRHGLCLLAPPYTGIPEPEDPLHGSAPGTNENGAIFCHANTWAIIAETMLGNAERAFRYYRRLVPEVAADTIGHDTYVREPYACVSTIQAPASGSFGRGGISWMTGTVAWMYMAATQYILGIRPALNGLCIRPCLPPDWPAVHVTRRFRGRTYEIDMERSRAEAAAPPVIRVNGERLDGNMIVVHS